MLIQPEIDLHTHSTASDGTDSPAEVVRAAHARGLSALALTDHDTVAGVAEAQEEADRLGMDFLPAIEVSCAFPRPGTMHILGYGVDPLNRELLAMTEELNAAREERNRMIVRRLNALGVDISWDEVREAAGGSVGRPHLASVLKRKGHVATTRQAFDQYLGGGGLAWVDNQPVDSVRAIATIRAAGGIASLAHPFQLRRKTFEQVEAMVRELAEQGMEGIETIHGSHGDEDVRRLTRLADRVGLLTTGGSDFHGSGKPWIRVGLANGRAIPRRFYDDLTAHLRGEAVLGSW